MSHKQWEAVAMVLAQVLVIAWVIRDENANPEQYETVRDVAVQLAWAIGIGVALTVGIIIAVVILVSIARGEELKDERADERDKAIAAKALRNAYFVMAIAGLSTLMTVAFGYPVQSALYILVGGMALAALTDRVSLLVYYGRG